MPTQLKTAINVCIKVIPQQFYLRGGGHGGAPRNTQPTLGGYPTLVSGVLNSGDRTKNAVGDGILCVAPRGETFA